MSSLLVMAKLLPHAFLNSPPVRSESIDPCASKCGCDETRSLLCARSSLPCAPVYGLAPADAGSIIRFARNESRRRLAIDRSGGVFRRVPHPSSRRRDEDAPARCSSSAPSSSPSSREQPSRVAASPSARARRPALVELRQPIGTQSVALSRRSPLLHIVFCGFNLAGGTATPPSQATPNSEDRMGRRRRRQGRDRSTGMRTARDAASRDLGSVAGRTKRRSSACAGASATVGIVGTI